MSSSAASRGSGSSEARVRKSDGLLRNGGDGEHVYNRIRILRNERGLSQSELAKRERPVNR